MLRTFALSLSLLILSSSTSTRPARAEPNLQVQPSAEGERSDQWIQRMTEARARREQSSRWAVPLMLGGAAALGAGFATLADVSDTSRLLFAASAVLPAALIVPAVLSAPPTKARWLAVGGFAFTAAFGAAGIVNAMDQKGCSGWCGNEKAVGWLAAGLLPSTLLLELAFIDRGPSLEELEAYARLPPQARPVGARKLLARIDRAERKAVALSVGIDLLAGMILGAGAAVVRDPEERAVLLGVGGTTLSLGLVTALVGLLKPTRLEQLALGRRPAAREIVFW